jgi:hypothetical protein
MYYFYNSIDKILVMRVHTIMTFLLSGIFINLTFCQQPEADMDDDQIELIQETTILPVDSSKHELSKKRFNTGLQAGTSFIYSPNNFYGPSFYLAPHISYNVSPKFQLRSGLIIEKSTFYPISKEEDLTGDILPMTRIFLYTSGSYLLTPKLTVSGTAYKSFDNMSNQALYQYPYSYNVQGMQLDFQYKINRSITVGFQVRKQNVTLSEEPYH